MSKKVLVIGGATLDNIIAYEEMETMIHQRRDDSIAYLLLEEGAKIEVTEQCAFSGGGATNTAQSFNKLGLDVSLFCKIGRDTAGEFVQKELQAFGINTDLISYSNDVGTATSFVVPSLEGDRTVFAYRGANATMAKSDLPLAQIAEHDFVYITSLSQQSAEQLPVIVSAAQQHKVPVAINPGKSQLKLGSSFLQDALSGIHTLLLNYEEAQQFMLSLLQLEEANDVKAGDKLDVDTAALMASFNLKQFFQRVLGMGPKIVVVTNGSEGVYVGTVNQLYFHPAKQVNAVNTLGAGDSFSSSFVAALQLGHDVETAMRWGVVNSAEVISHPDAKSGLLDQAAIENLANKIDAKLCQVKSW